MRELVKRKHVTFLEVNSSKVASEGKTLLTHKCLFNSNSVRSLQEIQISFIKKKLPINTWEAETCRLALTVQMGIHILGRNVALCAKDRLGVH